MAYKLLRFPQVEAATGLPRSTIYAKLADDDDDFPRPIRLGARSVGFLDSEIEDWIERRIRMSRPERRLIEPEREEDELSADDAST